MHACLLTCRMHLSDSIVALAPATGGCTKGEAPSDGGDADAGRGCGVQDCQPV